MFGRAVNVLSGFFVAVSILFVIAACVVPPAAVADSVSSSVAVVVPMADAGSGGGDAEVGDSGLQRLLSVLPDWLLAISMLVTACSSVAALTPTPKDDGLFLVLRRVVDFLALNFGGAKNANAIKDSRNIR